MFFSFQLLSRNRTSRRHARRPAKPLIRPVAHILVALIVASQFFGIDAVFSEALALTKKSSSGICHCPGGRYYDRTKKFTPYRSIAECLDSGGRHPKRGQGDCTRTAPGDPERPKAEARPAVPQSPTKAGKDEPNRIAVTSKAHVVDGDTIRLDVRLRGVDTPETHQKCRNAEGKPYACGKEATKALKKLIGKKKVRCVLEPEVGKYGRAIGYCYLPDGTDLNRWMVRQGYGLAYREYSTKYVADEEQARAAKRGIHAGEYIPPWDWRKDKRLPK